MANREQAEKEVAEKLKFQVRIEDAMFFLYRPEHNLPIHLLDWEGCKLYEAQALAVSLQMKLNELDGK